MTKEEVKKWFIERHNSCYAVVHDDYPNSVFLYYDESVVRKMKLCKLNDVECKIDKVTGLCLFQCEFKSGYLWCDYDTIWSFFEKNYSDNYTDIQIFITSILEEQNKFNVVLPGSTNCNSEIILEEQNKLNVLITQNFWWSSRNTRLKEKDKLKVLTPLSMDISTSVLFEDNYKLTII